MKKEKEFRENVTEEEILLHQFCLQELSLVQHINNIYVTEFEEQKKENDDDGNDEALKFSACNNDLNMKLRRERVNVEYFLLQRRCLRG